MEVNNPEHFFYVCNGWILKSLDDLVNFLKSGDEGAFYYHVNHEKNDFVAWVKEILKQKTLAAKLSKTSTPEEMLKVLSVKTRRASKSKSKKSIISEIKNAVFHG